MPRQLGIRKRSATIEKRAEGDARTIRLLISTPEPVYDEVLVHEDGAVDLTRIDKGLAPLLYNHDPNRVIGVVEREGLDLNAEEGLRINVRFSESDEAKGVLRDINDGILNGVSVGFRVHEWKKRDEKWHITRWEFLEASIASVPADGATGVGRGETLVDDEENNVQSDQLGASSVREEKRMPLKEITQIIRSAIPAGASLTVSDILEQVIDSAGEEPTKASVRAATIEIVNRTLLAEVTKRDEAIKAAELEREKMRAAFEDEKRQLEIEGSEQVRRTTVDAAERGKMEYKAERAIQLMGTSNDLSKIDGLEGEVHQEILSQQGRSGPAHGGFLVPWTALAKRNIAKHKASIRDYSEGIMLAGRTINATSAAGLLQDELMPSAFIEALRNKSLVGDLGFKVINLTQDTDIPKQLTTSAVSWFDPDATAAATNTNLTAGDISLEFRSLRGKVPFTRKTLAQARPEVLGLQMDDLNESFGEGLTTAIFSGTGANNQPTGIALQTGVNSVTIATAGSPTYANLVAMQTAVQTDNVRANQATTCYVTTPAVLQHMLTTLRHGTGTDRTIAEDMVGMSGMGSSMAMVAGVPVKYWNGLPANRILYGDFSQQVIGLFGSGVEYRFDEDQDAGGLVLRAFFDVDTNTRHPQAFARSSQ